MEDANTDDGSCEFGPWEINATDCNMTVLLPGDMSLLVEGNQISSAWIAVSDGDGNIYGSAYWETGTTTSIAVWGSNADDPGMDSDEVLNWLVDVDGENITGTANYTFGANTYSCNGLSGVSELVFASTGNVKT